MKSAHDINAGPELEALRQSRFYLELRPYVCELARKYPFSKSLQVADADDPALAPRDRFYLMLDFILGDVFRNVRTRRWVKSELLAMTEAARVDEVGSHFLYRSYLNELVVLMERLQRLNELVAKGTADEAFTKRLDLEVLQFFNPMLCDKRNHNHHELYLGYPREAEVSAALRESGKSGKQEMALRLFREAMGKQIEWFEMTERAFAPFLRGIFDQVSDRLKTENGWIEPKLPPSFSLESKLQRTLRSRYDHRAVFGKA